MRAVILVLIGQIAAGKSEAGRRLAARTGARLLTIDELRAEGADTSAAALARRLADAAEATPVVFECTGAAADFEEMLSGLERAGRSALVILLECSAETAMRRLRARAQWRAPVADGSWAPQLRWTEMQLRLVPADVSLATDKLSPDEVAAVLAAAWDAREAERRDAAAPPPSGKFSFSQLASFDVCPLAYRYKYIERRPEAMETEAMFLGRRLHEALHELHAGGGAANETALLAHFAARVAETLPPSVPRSQADGILARGSAMLRFHLANAARYESRTTIASEMRFALELAGGLVVGGAIDRVALAPSGTHEVIDYKTSSRKSTSRPRIPDLLQVATYGVAALLRYRVPAVLVCRHLVPTGEEERLVLREADIPRIRLALRRWIAGVWRSAELRARPGAHCGSCQFNPICPQAAVPPGPTALRGVEARP